jgi:hypothetical protein
MLLTFIYLSTLTNKAISLLTNTLTFIFKLFMFCVGFIFTVVALFYISHAFYICVALIFACVLRSCCGVALTSRVRFRACLVWVLKSNKHGSIFVLFDKKFPILD